QHSIFISGESLGGRGLETAGAGLARNAQASVLFISNGHSLRPPSFCSTGSGMSFKACLAMSPWFISRAPAASKAATQSSQGRFVALVIADVLVGLTVSLCFNDL